MRISTSWLQEFVETPPVSELSHIFEMAGIGVENYDAQSDVWTLEVTSNRGDWLSAIGLAREIAAMTNQRFRTPAASDAASISTPLPEVHVEIENSGDCARYCAMMIENVRVGDSPEWMQKRLTECGMRPVNNIVDATNYVMLETGQPLHAFDADRVLDSHIIVRRAKKDEKIITLDEAERELNDEVLAICDPRGPIAVAGVMGGLESEVTKDTSRILLESAHFSPARVRRGARVLDLSSEASRRFARWVDPDGVLAAASRVAQLIAETAGGKLIPGAADYYPAPVAAARVSLRPERCNAILGLQLSSENITTLLLRLGLKVSPQSSGAMEVSVPTWRRDIEREIDLIEEVARVHGYEQIPTTLPRTVNASAGRALSQRLEESARGVLLRCGLDEIITYSLENATSVARAGLDANTPVVALRNPLSDDYTQLRTSLLPSLLETLRRNALADSSRALRFFEFGKIYCPREEGNQQPNERRTIGIALLAAPPLSHWQKNAQPPFDFFTLKGIVENLLTGLGTPRPQFRPTRNEEVQSTSFHPGRCATLSIDAEDLGCLGEIHPDVTDRYELRHRAYAATLDFESLVRHITLVPQHRAFGRQPASDRDLALVVPEKIAASSIEKTVRRAGGALLEATRIFDVYAGAPIPSGHKSVAIALRFRASDRTLTDEEIGAALASIRQAAEKELGAQLRS